MMTSPMGMYSSGYLEPTGSGLTPETLLVLTMTRSTMKMEQLLSRSGMAGLSLFDWPGVIQTLHIQPSDWVGLRSSDMTITLTSTRMTPVSPSSTLRPLRCPDHGCRSISTTKVLLPSFLATPLGQSLLPTKLQLQVTHAYRWVTPSA